VQSTSRVSFVEVGLFLDIQQGRPDFAASLKKVVEEEDANTRVAVCCAGELKFVLLELKCSALFAQ
jgi:hypothetical protein